MTLVKQLREEMKIDKTRLATDLLVGVLRTFVYFAVGAMVIAILAGCLVVSAIANSSH